eukprot:CAMPEP_0201511234 /NCGR_PEP_ID=MMETSP0161_2-20130828/3712_1 /ASSEMBLY_ACC=CAM_ASM_000251 /TAXON_ID=180227 /ORGANISM="Neoparamoeba aestuarina, Strain SoJaBio B1-5/56/2" /LENGTH=145 /DNA_ID=CAMNT_0047906633 /DNA_START=106 /DNA_END=543 /DNA_ORIENTATION=-
MGTTATKTSSSSKKLEYERVIRVTEETLEGVWISSSEVLEVYTNHFRYISFDPDRFIVATGGGPKCDKNGNIIVALECEAVQYSELKKMKSEEETDETPGSKKMNFDMAKFKVTNKRFEDFLPSDNGEIQMFFFGPSVKSARRRP